MEANSKSGIKLARILKFCCLVLFILTINYFCNAQTAKICFTSSQRNADLVLRFTDSLPTADICVWIGRTTMADVDICFIKYPSSSSINISINENPAFADFSICFTTNPLAADKTISITPRITAADICVGIWDAPTSFTKNIYIKGKDPANLTMSQKVAILYYLGLLKKNR